MAGVVGAWRAQEWLVAAEAKEVEGTVAMVVSRVVVARVVAAWVGVAKVKVVVARARVVLVVDSAAAMVAAVPVAQAGEARVG